jgi:hypothetical protein
MNLATKAPKRTYQICKRCVMDTSDPWIEFDKDGICNHCTSFFYRYSLRVKPALQAGYAALDEVFDQIRLRNNKRISGYDCIIGISGGTDSSYCALLAAKFGLKILAVHLDNGWDTSLALSNIYQLASLPNVDYISYVLDWNKFRSIQRAFIESGVPDIELPTDIAICKAVFVVAERYRINTFVVGGNVSEEGILPFSWMYNPRDMRYASSVARFNGVSAATFSEVRFGFRDELYHRLLRHSLFFYPLDKIAYDKRDAVKALGMEIGWKPPAQKHSESVFTRFCQLIYQPRRHGFEYRRAHLSCEICLNRISRADALIELGRPALSALDETQDIAFVAHKLGYSIEELLDLINMPPRWYVDFPHKRRLLGIAYDAYRFIKRQPKLSNF